MNKNKLIFAIIWVILILLLFFVVLNLKKSWNSSSNTKTTWNFSIWMLWDNVDWWRLVVENFKKMYPDYSSKTISVESFSNYDDYSNALTAAIISNKAPDIFFLNNN